MIVQLFTDGACKGNPGPGGWGVLLRCDSQEKSLYGSENNTTNNRMELMAALQGLQALQRPCTVELYTDSQYLCNGMTKWLSQWKKNQWMSSSKQPVKNKDLWEQLDIVANRHKIQWLWVRGHSGHPENEYADMLANKAIDEMQKL